MSQCTLKEGFYTWWIRKMLQKIKKLLWQIKIWIAIFCIAWATSSIVILDSYPSVNIWDDPVWVILIAFGAFAAMAIAITFSVFFVISVKSIIKKYFKEQNEKYEKEGNCGSSGSNTD